MPATVATNDWALAPPIGDPLSSHWKDAPADEVNVTLPPAQKEVGPEAVIVGTNAPMVTLALPLAEQLLRVATTLSDTGVAVPTEKVIDAVPCPVCSVPLPIVHVYVAPATGPPAMLALTTLFAQADDGALIVAGGGALAVTVVGAEVPVQPFESVTVTL